MITIFDETSPRRKSKITLNTNIIHDIKKAESLGIWIYLRSSNDSATASHKIIKSHFNMDDQTYKESIDYLLKKRLIKVEDENVNVTALAAPEVKEYLVPFSVSNKSQQQT